MIHGSNNESGEDAYNVTASSSSSSILRPHAADDESQRAASSTTAGAATTATPLPSIKSSTELLKLLRQFRLELKAITGTADATTTTTAATTTSARTSKDTATKEEGAGTEEGKDGQFDDSEDETVPKPTTAADSSSSSDVDDVSAYHVARTTDEDVVEDELVRHLFLVADRYEPKSAARRFVQHFHTKLQLFGKEKLCKDHIALSDLTEEDKKVLTSRGIELYLSSSTSSSTSKSRTSSLKDKKKLHGEEADDDSTTQSKNKNTTTRGSSSILVFKYDKLRKHCKEPANTLRAAYYVLQIAMNNRQVQEHGITVIGSTSSDAGATAAITDPSSAVSGGSGGSTGVGGNHDNDDNHHHQQQQVQLPFEELVQCIRSVPIRVVNVHFCAHGGGREGGENPQERKDVFTDLLSKEAKTTTKIHTGSCKKYVRKLLPDTKPVDIMSIGESTAENMEVDDEEEDGSIMDQHHATVENERVLNPSSTGRRADGNQSPPHPSEYLSSTQASQLSSLAASNPMLLSLQAQQQSRDSALLGLSQAARLGLPHPSSAASSLSAQHILAAQARALATNPLASASLSQILAAHPSGSLRSPFESIYGDPMEAAFHQRLIQNPYLAASDLEAALLSRTAAAPMFGRTMHHPSLGERPRAAASPGDELGSSDRRPHLTGSKDSSRPKKRSRDDEAKLPRTDERINPSALGGSGRGADSAGRGRQGNKHASPVCIYTESDDDTISAFQCLARQQIEFFAATEEDVQSNTSRMNKGIVVGQVGIRCRHCAILPSYSRPTAAVYYPRTLDSLYQFGQNLVKNHLCASCQLIPESTKKKMEELSEVRRRGKGGREHWSSSAKALGVVEDANGLRFR